MASPPGARRKGKGASPRPWLQLNFKTEAFILVHISYSFQADIAMNNETIVFLTQENLKGTMT